MQQDEQLAGADNRVFSVWAGPASWTWRERGTAPYAKGVVPYPEDAVLPRAAIFVVGNREYWYDSAASQAAHAAWLAATDPGRETAVCLSLAGSSEARSATAMGVVNEGADLPLGSMDGIGEVRTTTYGTHAAITTLEIASADREPVPGTIWLSGGGRWERPQPPSSGPALGKIPYLMHHELFTAPSPAPAGIQPGLRWLCPHQPGTLLWWRLVAFSLTTPGHDVVLIEPGGRHWKSDAAKTKATAMGATAAQWSWVRDNWGSEVSELGLEHVVIVERNSSPATERWLRGVFPRARITYGFA